FAEVGSQNDYSSGIVFDTHSKMVMSQGGTFEKMKEKVMNLTIIIFKMHQFHKKQPRPPGLFLYCIFIGLTLYILMISQRNRHR
uniref:Uncharacterized protein n=1 Tax=Astyanax mexicanus TaxID=7994 RepID=A0A8B9H4K7_ASTMX